MPGTDHGPILNHDECEAFFVEESRASNQHYAAWFSFSHVIALKIQPLLGISIGPIFQTNMGSLFGKMFRSWQNRETMEEDFALCGNKIAHVAGKV